MTATTDTFTNNTGASYGGAIYNIGTLTTTNDTFTNNTAPGGYWSGSQGGAIYNNGALTSANDTFTNNSVYGGAVGGIYGGAFGGAIYNSGTLTTTNDIFTHNVADSDSYGGGGAIYNSNILTTINDTFTDNTADSGYGGAIYNDNTTTITSNTFNQNAAIEGGGIYTTNAATVISSTFTSNTATDGGGVYSSSYLGLTISNNTFYSNTANYGGGIYNEVPEFSSITIYSAILDSTISGNISSLGGGGIYYDDANDTGPGILLENTIVAGNTGPDPDIYGTVDTTSTYAPVRGSNYNLIGNGSGIINLSSLNNTNFIGTTTNPINPMLGPIQNNGGPTDTMALLPGSPAIGAGSVALLAVDVNGNPLQYDQRGPGYPRTTNGAVDIGAYEDPQLTPTVSVVDNGGTYNGTAFPATATVYGQSSLEGVTPTLDYQQYINGAWTNLSPNAPVPVNAGSYDVTANFAGSTDYTAASSPTVDFNIGQAPLTITATSGITKVYDGTTNVSATPTFQVPGLPVDTLYVNSISGPDTMTGLSESFTSPNAGPEATIVSPGFAINDGNGANNYAVTINPGTGYIAQASAHPSVTAISGLVYTGVSQETAIYAATDVNGNALPSSDFSDLTVHTNAGQNTDSWTFSDPSGNYAPASGTVTDNIAQASAHPSVTAISGLVYTGVSQETAIYAATDVNGNALPSSDFSDLTVHTNAGQNTDSWTFSDPSGNYAPASGTVTDNIAQASAHPSVTAISGLVYTGVSQETAIYAATDVNGNALPSSDFSDLTVHTNAGQNTDSWTFSDPSGNYAPASGTVIDNIAQASANPSVTAISGLVYTGLSQETASYSATGVNGAALPSSDFSDLTVHTDAGQNTDSWTFSDPSGNYAPASGTVIDNIAQASANPSVTAISGLVYTGLSQETASYSATGVNGAALPSSDFSDLTVHTDAGQNTDSWTFSDPSGNYAPASGTVIDNIAQASANPSVTAISGLVYTGLSQETASYSATGVNGAALPSSDFSDLTVHTDAGQNTDSWTFSDPSGNYAPASGTVIDNIAQASANPSVTAISGLVYTGLSQETASYSATGVNGAALPSSDFSDLTVHTDAGQNTDSWTFSDPSGNYAPASGTVIDNIAQASANPSVTAISGLVYTGLSQETASYSATGVNGAALPSSDFSDLTVHTDAGQNTDSWTFSDPSGNYAPASGTVIDNIAQASANPSVTAISGLVYTGLSQETASYSATGVNGAALPSSDFSDLTVHTDAGQNTDSWTFSDPSGNYAPASGTVIDNIAQASANPSVTAISGLVYTGVSQETAIYAATDVNGNALPSSDFSDLTVHTNTGQNTDSWTFSDPSGNYAPASGTVIDNIAQASANPSVTAISGLVYTGLSQETASYSATGVNGAALPSSDFSDLTVHTDAGQNTDSWTFSDPSGNYAPASGTVIDNIAQASANPSVTAISGLVYTGLSQETASYSATGVNGAALPSSDFSDLTVHTDAGQNTDSWTFSDPSGNYAPASGTVIDNIAQASANPSVTAISGLVYTGLSQETASYSATGVNGAALPSSDFSDLTVHTDAGQNTDSWTFSDPSGNYAPASGTVIDNIAQASANPSVTAISGLVYTGLSQETASYSATGVNGAALPSSDFSDLTVHTDAGQNTDSWTFSDPSGNYAPASGTVIDNIAQASANPSVTAISGLVYTGLSQETASYSATGVNGAALPSSDFSDLTVHTDAGQNTDSWTFSDPSGNYAPASGTVIDNIAQASANPSVTAISGLVYTGVSQETAIYAATDVNGNALPSSDFSDLTVHTNTGQNTDSWTFSDPSGNYAPASGTVIDNIAQASANPSVTAISGLVYTGLSQETASYSATGVNGAALPSSDFSDLTVHTDAGQNTDSWTFSDPSGNYAPASGTVIDNIAQASANPSVTAISGLVYTGLSQETASYSATGVNGAALPSSDFSDLTVHTDAGQNTDSWTFSDPSGNYAPASGTVIDNIAQASANPSVTAISGLVYTGLSQETASYSATGVNGAALPSSDFSDLTVHTDAGQNTDSWTFSDPSGNYAPASGTVIDNIAQASANPSVTAISGLVYTGLSQETASYSATGVNGAALPSSDFSDLTVHTDAGQNTDSWTFSDPSGNYAPASGTVIDNIAQASANPSVTAISGLVYTGLSQETASYSATGVNGANLDSDLTVTATHTNAGTYTDSWSFTDLTGNYAPDSGTMTDNIGQATATVSVTSILGLVYNGAAQETASYSATGVNSTVLPSTDFTDTAVHTNAGSYPDTWTFTDPNYVTQNGSLTDNIAQATATVSVTPYSVTYVGNAHTVTGTANGVGGVKLPASDLNLTGTTHTNAGTYSDTWTFADPNYVSQTGTVTDTIVQAHAPATLNQVLVEEDYRVLLNRAAEPGGLTYWSTQLNNGVTPNSVGMGIANSTESKTDIVTNDYQSFLNRDSRAGWPCLLARPAPERPYARPGGGRYPRLGGVFRGQRQYEPGLR